MSLFGKLFSKKSQENGSADPERLIEQVLDGLIDSGRFSFSYDITRGEAGDGSQSPIMVEIFGDDEELLRTKEGQLLDAIQLFLTRVIQHQLRDEKVTIQVDNSGFREQANQELIDLAEKLKDIAVNKGKPVYFRALPPRERKVVHQYLAADGRVKSRSVGDGLFKKIKIYPIKGEDNREEAAEQATT